MKVDNLFFSFSIDDDKLVMRCRILGHRGRGGVGSKPRDRAGDWMLRWKEDRRRPTLGCFKRGGSVVIRVQG